MLFKPANEKMLEHLLSNKQAQDELGIEYVGVVLNNKGQIEKSPDAILKDRRHNKVRLRRCEFKLTPKSAKEFSHNGKFDLAIVWSLGGGLDRSKLLQSLRTKHGCEEIIVLEDDFKFFSDLPVYTYQNTNNDLETLKNISWAEKYLMSKDFSSLFVASIFVHAYPNHVDIQKLYSVLEKYKNKPEYKKIKSLLESGKGKANIFNQFTQKNKDYPLFLEKKPNNEFKWGLNYSPDIMKSLIKKIAAHHNNKSLPDDRKMKEIVSQVIAD
jgi:hypothetical protein